MSAPNRRAVLSTAGLVAVGGALAGCTPAQPRAGGPTPAPPGSAGPTSASTTAAPSAEPSTPPPSSASSSAPPSSAPPSAAPSSSAPSVPDGPSVPIAQIPVGGGFIIASAYFLVTQPTAGEFKAFDKRCTHAGCPVAEIVDGAITCYCHGSRFSITDGSVVRGPATEPLTEATATVTGDVVVVTD